MARRVPLVIEVHPPQLELSGGSADAVLALLVGRRYAVEVLDHNPNSLFTVLAAPLGPPCPDRQ